MRKGAGRQKRTGTGAKRSEYEKMTFFVKSHGDYRHNNSLQEIYREVWPGLEFDSE